MADSAETNPAATTTAPPTAVPAGNPYFASLLAWVIPGLGHVYLKRWRRGLLFLFLVAVSIWVGCALEGNLYQPQANQPLSLLATIGALGMGFPYLVLRFMIGYAGDVIAPGYEYGTAFLLTAGLMNWLLVLDAWDISRGRKD